MKKLLIETVLACILANIIFIGVYAIFGKIDKTVIGCLLVSNIVTCLLSLRRLKKEKQK